MSSLNVTREMPFSGRFPLAIPENHVEALGERTWRRECARSVTFPRSIIVSTSLSGFGSKGRAWKFRWDSALIMVLMGGAVFRVGAVAISPPI